MIKIKETVYNGIVVIAAIIIIVQVSELFSGGGGFGKHSPDKRKAIIVMHMGGYTEITQSLSDNVSKSLIAYKSDAPEMYLRGNEKNLIQWSSDSQLAGGIYYDVINDQKVRLEFEVDLKNGSWILRKPGPGEETPIEDFNVFRKSSSK
jgi:hypothetical protein